MVDRKTPARGIGRGRDADPIMARVDRALSSWPSPPEDRTANDARAAAVLGRVGSAGPVPASGSGSAGPVTDDELLAPPLPAARDEGASWPLAGPGPVAWLRKRGAVVIAIAAIAAGFVALGLRHRAGDGGLATKTQAPPAGSQAIRAVPPPPSEPVAGTLDVPSVDPASLPLAAAGGPAAAGPVPGAAPRRPGSVARPSGASAPSRPASNAGEAVEPGLDPTLVPAAAVAPGSSLDPGPWSVPRRPSFGAVQGAFGAVLPTARACLDPTDPPCRATVTFQSDGTVRDISLADVDPTRAECVKAALGKASVPAFAEGAYPAPVTVRTLAR
jgi:hypothetical protein